MEVSLLSRCISGSPNEMTFGIGFERMIQPIFTCASVVVQHLRSVDDKFDRDTGDIALLVVVCMRC